MKKVLLFIAAVGLFCLNHQETLALPTSASVEQSTKIFKAGAFNLEQDKLVRNCEYNVSSYVEHYVKGKNRKMFWEAYRDLIIAINEGRVSRDFDRKLSDSKGRLHNNNGKGYDAMGQAVDFVNKVIDNMIRTGNYMK